MMSKPISAATAENFKWGHGVCDGWYLLKSEPMSIVEEIMPAGGLGVVHYHSAAQHFLYVLRGDVSLVIDQEKHLLKKGDGITISPKAEHQIRNESDDEVNFLVFSAPDNFTDKFTKGEDY